MKYARRKTTKTLKKHDEIRVIAESKLNTINSHVSKAIEDGCISQEEFVLISDERAKYSEFTPRESPKDAPEDTPPDIKTINDKEKKTNRKTIEFKIKFSKNKSYDDDLVERIKRLERLRESDRPPAYIESTISKTAINFLFFTSNQLFHYATIILPRSHFHAF